MRPSQIPYFKLGNEENSFVAAVYIKAYGRVLRTRRGNSDLLDAPAECRLLRQSENISNEIIQSALFSIIIVLHRVSNIICIK